MAVAKEMIEGTDWPQTADFQNEQWEIWKANHPELKDSDRLGPATGAYNCHAYIFNNSQYWIPAPSRYKGTSPGCYIEDPNGTIRSNDLLHSCTVDYVGKCGDGFLMKRNDLIYGDVLPIYRKITKVNTVLIIDRSGSMDHYGYIGPAKRSAKMFVDLMKPGDGIGVVSFNESASVRYSFTTLDIDGSVKTAAKSAIGGISAEGATSIGAGLSKGRSQLMAAGSNTPFKTMVLLSDGMENTGPWVQSVISSVRNSGIRVYTIAHGSQEVDKRLLKDIAKQTGGKFFRSPSSATLGKVYYNITSNLTGTKQVKAVSNTIQQGAIQTANMTVDSTMSNVDFTCMWQGSDIDIVLVDPDQNVINPAAAASNEGITYTEGETYEFYKIADPAPGQWQIQATGMDIPPEGESYTVASSGISPLGLSVAFNKHEYLLTEVMGITATLFDPAPIAGSAVTAVMTTPSATYNLTLHDDGAHGDGGAADGVYGISFDHTAEQGAYTLEVYAEGTSNTGESFNRTKTGTTVVVRDSDNDGMSDGWEDFNGLNKYEDDAGLDSDGDGLINIEEYRLLTDPQEADPDEDGFNDSQEIRCGTDPFDSSFYPTDSDEDGLCDQWEIKYESDLNPASDDDLDGLTNLEEYNYRCNPEAGDSDGDGLNDSDEVNVHGTDPSHGDTDCDGLNDGDEINIHGTDPFDPDSEDDGMPDRWELAYGLNPMVNDANQDADGDGRTNVDEYNMNTDPTNPNSPPSPYMSIVLDRSGSMRGARCSAALDQAKSDLADFFNEYPLGLASVWIFKDDAPIPLTSGHTDQATASATLEGLDPDGCLWGSATPLADAICTVADDYPSDDHDRIMSLLTDGGESSSSGACSGDSSEAEPPPAGNYDPGSWQLKAWQKCRDNELAVNVWFWDDFGKAGITSDGGEKGDPTKSGVDDEIFLQDLTVSTGGSYNGGPAGPRPPSYEEPVPVPGPVLLLIPLALLLCGLGGRAYSKNRS